MFSIKKNQNVGSFLPSYRGYWPLFAHVILAHEACVVVTTGLGGSQSGHQPGKLEWTSGLDGGQADHQPGKLVWGWKETYPVTSCDVWWVPGQELDCRVPIRQQPGGSGSANRALPGVDVRQDRWAMEGCQPLASRFRTAAGGFLRLPFPCNPVDRV